MTFETPGVPVSVLGAPGARGGVAFARLEYAELPEVLMALTLYSIFDLKLNLCCYKCLHPQKSYLL